MLISPQKLHAILGQPGVVVLDASWYMPAEKRDTKAEFETEHIPGAIFFDIEDIKDHSAALPHMLPSAPEFSQKVGALGISNRHKVVVYDTAGLFSAARAWWMFRAFGHTDVAVLEGGLPAWKAQGFPLESKNASPQPASYQAALNPSLISDVKAVQDNLSSHRAIVLDARSKTRFSGAEPEPRSGLRSGHIPGSKSLPYKQLLEESGLRLRPRPELEQTFKNLGVDRSTPVITTCGSGVTAAIIALALSLCGHEHWRLYDGSWAEWGDSAGDAASRPVAVGE